jgi:hypothetical protein
MCRKGRRLRYPPPYPSPTRGEGARVPPRGEGGVGGSARSCCSTGPNRWTPSPRFPTGRRCASPGAGWRGTVVRAEGPERIAPEWWRDGTGGTRDYYVIEDQPAAATGCSARACMARTSNRPGSSTACSPEGRHDRVRRTPGHQQFLLPARRLAPEELVVQAKHLGLNAMAVTDHNSLAGIVRAHVQAKETGLRFVVGARLDLSDTDGSEPAAPPPPAPPHEGEGGRSVGRGWGWGGRGKKSVTSPFSPGPPTGRPTGGCAGS